MRMPSNRIKLIAIVSALVGTAAVFLAQSHTIAGGAKPKSEERRAKVRNVIVMREIKFSSDWNTDPTAVPQFLFQLRERTGAKKRWKSFGEPIEFGDDEIFSWPLVYLTGHDGFEFTPKERENIRRYVLNSGVIWADDCLPGASAFMKDFRSEMKKIFPKQTFEEISKEDPRFASAYWLFYEVEKEPGCIWAPPIDNLVMLIGGQVAVLITMNDYGCAWEVSTPPTQDEPIGMGMHAWTGLQREAAYKFSANLMYYLLTH